MAPIKNIIFDLGGVFLTLDYLKTEQAFTALGVTDFEKLFKQDFSSALFEDLETGKISPEAFYDAFRETTQLNLTNQQIQDAWNALLGHFPPERLEWLSHIQNKYNIYLYSNTNQIHYDHFMQTFPANIGNGSFNQYFRKAWYSHELGLRKPYPGSYLRILEIEGLEAAETLFIDDTLKNIEGAREAGLQTIHLIAPHTVLDLDL